MQEFSRKERQFYERCEGIDPSQVSKHMLGQGAQHRVRAYGKDQVLKVRRSDICNDPLSLLVSPFITGTCDNVRRQLDTCLRYFPGYVVPTNIQPVGKKGESYYMLQPRLDLRSFPSEEASPALRAQLGELIEGNRRMIRDLGAWFDFMGWNMQKLLSGKPYLDNVSVVQENNQERLRLHDCTVFPMPYTSMKGLFHAPMLSVQQYNMLHLGFSLSGNPTRDKKFARKAKFAMS